MSKVIVQYIVVRRDLNWPLGALMAQACHASTAATHLHYQHPGNSSGITRNHCNLNELRLRTFIRHGGIFSRFGQYA